MAAVGASRIEVFDVVAPAGTPKAAPVEVPTSFAAGEVIAVELVFPDGCAGLVGARLAVGHAQAIPSTPGAWLLGNDDSLRYPVTGQLNNGAWSVFLYNTDIYDHSLHVRFSVVDFNYLGGSIAGNPAVIPPPS